MTIKKYYEEMKAELRRWNKRHDWDGTNFCYHIKFHSKKAKTIFVNLLNRDFENLQFDIQHKIITVEKFNREMKVWNDMSCSIANMVIF